MDREYTVRHRFTKVQIMNKIKITADELQKRLNWSLNQKIDHTIGTVESFIYHTQKTPYISFSGGKDSTVLLDICRRFVDKSMKAVFDNTGNEFPEIVNFVKNTENVTIISPHISIRDVISQYGFPLISKEVARYIRDVKTTKSLALRQRRLEGRKVSDGRVQFKIPDKWKYLINSPFMISEQCCDILKKRPFARYNKLTGEVPIIATMVGESRLRFNLYLKRGGCNSFNNSHLASFPLSIWTEHDVWEYIKQFNVNICSLYSHAGCHRTGCMFCGFGAHLEKESRFKLLKELHPALYTAILNYSNNGISYRDALLEIGVSLPDNSRQLTIDF